LQRCSSKIEVKKDKNQSIFIYINIYKYRNTFYYWKGILGNCNNCNTATTATVSLYKNKKELFGGIKKYVYLCTHESSDTTS
jgi:hypothetical protein